MKRTLRTMIGCLLAAAGGSLVFLCIQQTLDGFWVWLSVIPIGLMAVLAGVMIVSGEGIEETLKELVSIFIWWTPG